MNVYPDLGFSSLRVLSKVSGRLLWWNGLNFKIGLELNGFNSKWVKRWAKAVWVGFKRRILSEIELGLI